MATRLYFPSSGTTPNSNITFGSQWASVSSNGGQFPTSTTKTNTALTLFSDTSGAATTDRALMQYQTNTLNVNQTISGTFSIVVSCSESNAQANTHLAVLVRAVDANNTVRGTLLSELVTSTEFATSASTRIFSSVALTSTACLAGDRLVIEIGFHEAAPSSGRTLNETFGDPSATADFALTANLTTNLDPWCEFSQNITFGNPSPTGMEISHFRFYNDDGNLGAASAVAAQDTNATLQPNTIYRIRFQSLLQSAPPTTVTRILEYATSSSGPWTQATTTVGSGPIIITSSSYFSDGTATSQLLSTPTGGTSFTAGQALSTSNQTSSINFTVGLYTEDVFSFLFESPASGTYFMRVSSSGTGYGVTGQLAQATVSTSPLLVQAHYRVYQDDAALNSASPYADEDTSYSIQKSLPFRLRIQTQNNGAGSATISRRLEWRTGTNAWAAISTTGEVKLNDSTQFTDGAATTHLLGGTLTGHTFQAGQGKDTGSTTSSISLTATAFGNDNYTEDEWSLIFDSSALNDTDYHFRITNSGTVLDTYAVDAIVNAAAPPTYDSYGAPFLYTAANWGTVTFYLEVYMRATVTGLVFARLYNETDSTAVANSTMSTSSQTMAAYRSSAITLTDGKTYRVQFGHGTGKAGAFLSGRIIVTE